MHYHFQHVSLLWFFVHRVCSAPLSVKLPSQFDKDDVAQLSSVENLARANSDESVMNRNFGENADTVGHESVFLHQHLDAAAPQLRSRMLEFAARADQSAGWNVFTKANLSARCIEVIHYKGAEQADIGWHSDGGTLITVAAMLSSRAKYEGGQIQFRQGDINEQHDLAFGDVLVWKGWIDHRVLPVIQGERDVFVVEWWLGEDCAVSNDPRAKDDLRTLEHAARLEPTDARLQRWLGKAHCLRLPCASEDSAESAENAFRAALEMEPTESYNSHAYGIYLTGSENSTKRDAGMQLLLDAYSLNPSDDALRLSLDHASGKAGIANTLAGLSFASGVALVMWCCMTKVLDPVPSNNDLQAIQEGESSAMKVEDSKSSGLRVAKTKKKSKD
jgi:hypothetical protein